MFVLLSAVLMLTVLISATRAGDFYWDDGGSYLINDETYKTDWVHVDYNTANDPGTHVDLVDGGEVNMLLAYNNATVTMTGGWADFISCYNDSTINVTGGLAPLRAHDNSTINISGGDVGAEAWGNSIINIYDGSNVAAADAADNGHINIYGGDIYYRVNAGYDSVIDMFGGNFSESIGGYDNSEINVYGGNVYSHISGYGNSEINVYGYDLVLSATGGTYNYGTLVGYLQDDTPINVDLKNSEAYLHINLVPEPSMLTLTILGTCLLKKTGKIF